MLGVCVVLCWSLFEFWGRAWVVYGHPVSRSVSQPRASLSLPPLYLYNPPNTNPGEKFVQFWDRRTSQWLYRNAAECFVYEGRLARQAGGMSPASFVKEAGTVLVHWLCFQASGDGYEAASMLLAKGVVEDAGAVEMRQKAAKAAAAKAGANGGGGNVG